MDFDFTENKVKDACRLCDKNNSPRFVGFLDARQATIAKSAAEKSTLKHKLFSGYDEGERVVLGIFPDWCDMDESYFPIAPVTAGFRKSNTLTHRDFLGTLMSIGIVRESVGDILIGEGFAVIFLLKNIVPFVISQIDKIGGEGVQFEEGITHGLPQPAGFIEIKDSIPSARLDCIVSSLSKSSRGKSAELIESGMVTINSLLSEKITKIVKEGDRISIRKSGKFIIDSLSNRTKKDRIVLMARKYL